MSPGWPPCANAKCPAPGMPGLFRIEVRDGSGATWAYLCLLCVLEAPACVAAAASARAEARLAAPEKAEGDRGDGR